MTAFSNSRLHPNTNAFAWRAMDLETHTIAEFDELPGYFGIQLQDIPNPDTILITAAGTTGEIYTKIITGNPNPGEFRVGGRTGKIFFNVANNGASVIAEYDGGGTATTIDHLADMAAGATDFNDAAFRIHDTGDSTRKLAFDAGAISASTTRTLVAPDANGTIALISDIPAALQNYLHVRDEKSAGTDGGDFNSGAWRTRTLNTVKTNNITGASLASNQITLPAGTYRIFATAPARNCDQHKAKLRNVSDLIDTIIGTSEFASSIGHSTSRSIICGLFTIAAEKIFEIQHYCITTQLTDGFGSALNATVAEVYTEVEIWKLD